MEAPKIVNHTTVETYSWGAGCLGSRLLNTDFLSVKHEQMPAGAVEQLHYHEKTTQFFYVLSGEATFTVEGAEFLVTPGNGIAIHFPQKHFVANRGTEELRFLVISHPKPEVDRINI